MKAQRFSTLVFIVGFCLLTLLVEVDVVSTRTISNQTGWAVFQLPIPPEFGNITTSDRRIIWQFYGGEIIYIFDLHTHQIEEYVVSDEETCPNIVPNDSRWSLDWPWLVMPADCSQLYNGLLDDSLLAINLETGVDKLIPIPAGETPPDNVNNSRLHDGQVVWVAGDRGSDMSLWIDPATHRLYLSDVETGVSTVLADDPPPLSEAVGSVSGEWTAWDTVHLDNFDHIVHVYNVTSSEHITIPIDDYTPFPTPRFNGKWVYWPVDGKGVVWQGLHLGQSEIVTLFDSNTIDPSFYACAWVNRFATQIACLGGSDTVQVYDFETQELVIIFDGEELFSISEFEAEDDVIVWRTLGSGIPSNDLRYYAAIKVSHYIHLPLVAGP